MAGSSGQERQWKYLLDGKEFLFSCESVSLEVGDDDSELALPRSVVSSMFCSGFAWIMRAFVLLM